MTSPPVSRITPPTLLDLWPAPTALPSSAAASASAPAQAAPFDRVLTSASRPPQTPDAPPTHSPPDDAPSEPASSNPAVPGSPNPSSPTSTASRPGSSNGPPTEKSNSSEPPRAAEDQPADALSEETPDDTSTQTLADPEATALAALAGTLPNQVNPVVADGRNIESTSSTSETELEPSQPAAAGATGHQSQTSQPGPTAEVSAAPIAESPHMATSYGTVRAAQRATRPAPEPHPGSDQPHGDGTFANTPQDPSASSADISLKESSDSSLTVAASSANRSANPAAEPSAAADGSPTDGLRAHEQPSTAEGMAAPPSLAEAQAMASPSPGGVQLTQSSDGRFSESGRPSAAVGAGHASASQTLRHQGDTAGQVSGPERASAAWPDSPLVARVARALALAQQRDGEVRLRLSPPELGMLRIELRVQEGALVAQLHTETEAARSAILDQLPVLRDRLADQGIRLERFDVDLMPRGGGHAAGQFGGQSRDWPVPPRAAAPLLPAALEPRPADTTASPRRPLSPPGGLDVIV